MEAVDARGGRILRCRWNSGARRHRRRHLSVRRLGIKDHVIGAEDMSAPEVHAVLDGLAAAGCHAWIGGGWGVDALVGNQTRGHRDLDLAVDADHEAAALVVLGKLDYVIETDWRPVRVEVVAPGVGEWTYIRWPLMRRATAARPASRRLLPLPGGMLHHRHHRGPAGELPDDRAAAAIPQRLPASRHRPRRSDSVAWPGRSRREAFPGRSDRLRRLKKGQRDGS